MRINKVKKKKKKKEIKATNKPERVRAKCEQHPAASKQPLQQQKEGVTVKHLSNQHTHTYEYEFDLQFKFAAASLSACLPACLPTCR